MLSLMGRYNRSVIAALGFLHVFITPSNFQSKCDTGPMFKTSGAVISITRRMYSRDERTPDGSRVPTLFDSSWPSRNPLSACRPSCFRLSDPLNQARRGGPTSHTPTSMTACDNGGGLADEGRKKESALIFFFLCLSPLCLVTFSYSRPRSSLFLSPFFPFYISFIYFCVCMFK